MRVIINADDFGYSQDTVNATIECIERGAVSSASIMPKMPCTREAVDYARRKPGVSFGVHLTFSRDDLESPVLRPESLPTLTDSRGGFCDAREIRVRTMLRRLSVEEIAREAAAQIGVLYDCGIAPTHVDSHGHLHKFPAFRAALQRVLPAFGIRCVRTVQDIYIQKPLKSPTYWLGAWWRAGIQRRFTTTRHFFMPTSAHDALGWTGRLVDSMAAGEETMEVGVHPGHQEDWRQQEYDAALALAARLRDAGHRLVSWGDLSHSAEARAAVGGYTRR